MWRDLRVWVAGIMCATTSGRIKVWALVMERIDLQWVIQNLWTPVDMYWESCLCKSQVHRPFCSMQLDLEGLSEVPRSWRPVKVFHFRQRWQQSAWYLRPWKDGKRIIQHGGEAEAVQCQNCGYKQLDPGSNVSERVYDWNGDEMGEREANAAHKWGSRRMMSRSWLEIETT